MTENSADKHVPGGEAYTGFPIIVAGHLCLDIAPDLSERSGAFSKSIEPGQLINTGPAKIGPGGCVANTGLAVLRLGQTVRLLGKIGADGFGDAIRRSLEERRQGLSDWLHVAQQEASSYTLVFDPPDEDRMFFHYPGVNDTFSPADVQAVLDAQRGAQPGVFHFGYPPLMKAMRQPDDLEAMYARVRELGYTTSLDMAWPDPKSDAGRTDWRGLLERVLPQVDFFLPSIDEIILMLHPERFEELLGRVNSEASVVARIADELLEMGAAVVGLKLGANGVYLRTTSDAARLSRMGAAGPGMGAAGPGSESGSVNVETLSDGSGNERLIEWQGRELLCPTYPVEVRATTGAGDCTIAGLLSALSRRDSPEEVLRFAAATGACSVESEDATGGIPLVSEIRRRRAEGWRASSSSLAIPGWRQPGDDGLIYSPRDAFYER